MLITLLAGFAGAAIFTALGIPAGSLLGSALAVSILAAATKQAKVPDRLRDFSFIAIGVALGSGVDPGFVNHLGEWAISLVMLSLSLLSIMLVGPFVLRRWFGFDPQSAVLATAPGVLSNVIAMALEGRGDLQSILAVQVSRMLVLVMLVPPLASLLKADTGDDAPRIVMQILPLAGLMILSFFTGRLGEYLRFPAAGFLAGLVVSGAGHISGLVIGDAPAWFIFLSLTVAGSALGTRLTSTGGASLGRMATASLAVLIVTMLLSMLFAALTSSVSGLPLAQVWIAFAPGAVEAMSAIGLSLGYDPAYVAIHHFLRIIILVMLIPILLPRTEKDLQQGARQVAVAKSQPRD